MLTRNLLRVQNRKTGLYPRFIPLDYELETLEKMISLFSSSQGQARDSILNQTESLKVHFKDPKLFKGILHTLLRSCHFTQQDSIDYPALRVEIFIQTSKLLRSQSFDSPHTLRNLLKSKFSSFPKNLYGDLPIFETLLSFDPISPKELINRYNHALIQTILLDAKTLRLSLEDDNVSNIRRIFKGLKFRRLLFEINQQGPHKFEILISGPLTILEKTQKYGIQIGQFFPLIPTLKRWSIEGEIKFKNKNTRFSLNHKNKFISPLFQRLLAYEPEEISHFKQSLENWPKGPLSPSKEIGLLPLNSQQLILADITFYHEEKHKSYYIELFHRWHHRDLAQRIEWLAEHHKEHHYFLGIDQSIAKKRETKKLLKKANIGERVFQFNHYPSMSEIHDLLINSS